MGKLHSKYSNLDFNSKSAFCWISEDFLACSDLEDVGQLHKHDWLMWNLCIFVGKLCFCQLIYF